jgi:glutamine synthetase
MAIKPEDSSAAVSKVLSMLTENSVEYVDLRFTDPRGKWQHTAQHVSTVDADVFTDGFMFDGSSIAGWKAINESDMILMPDPATAVMDPFAAKPGADLRHHGAVDRAVLRPRPPRHRQAV